MCGRATLNFNNQQEIEDFLSAIEGENFSSLLNSKGGFQNYNAPPTTVLPICYLSKGQRVMNPAYWWFMKWPTKDKKPNFKYSTFNARADKLMSSNLWKSVISDPTARCIIPLSGYYEFSGKKGNKNPHYFYPTNQSFFAVAGLCSPISPNDGMRSFTIITTEPNEVQKPVHDRMPALLLPNEIEDWLNPGNSSDFIIDMLKPYPKDAMDQYIVTTKVNNTKNNYSSLIQKTDSFT